MQIKSFQNVLDQGYRVLVIRSTIGHEILAHSDPNTAMHRVYQEMLERDSFIPSVQAAYNRLLVRDSLTLSTYEGTHFFLRQTAKQTRP
jgi:hypothetical protein